MRTRLAIGLLILISSPVSAVDYWPHPAGAIYTYQNAGGAVLEVTYGSSGTRISHYQGPGYILTEQFAEDANGDVVLTFVSGYAEGAIDPDYFRDLGAAFVFLDSPLTLGKTWTSLVNTTCCYDACAVSLSATVTGGNQVTVPAGTFTVVEVAFTNTTPLCVPDLPSGTMALEKSLGPVVLPGGYELVSVTGVVGVQRESWGSLKSLYR
jgi:hypothetical protein